jgi:hypothetical protein
MHMLNSLQSFRYAQLSFVLTAPMGKSCAENV